MKIFNKHYRTNSRLLATLAKQLSALKTWFTVSQYAYAEVKSYGKTPSRLTGIYHGRMHGCGYLIARRRQLNKLHRQ